MKATPVVSKETPTDSKSSTTHRIVDEEDQWEDGDSYEGEKDVNGYKSNDDKEDGLLSDEADY